MESNCLNYSGHISKTGYGLDYDPKTKKTILAHRLAFYNHYGYLPEVVMHKCDNTQCVNPLHLQGGTQSDNIKDCVKKGRYSFSKRKLKEDDIKHILSSSFSQRALAKYYGVTQRVIYDIKAGNTYKEWTGKGGSCGV